ncbi:L-ribulose-5-phosphate 4-epimerase [Curtobacterium sp. RRHDQ10]|uniref:L-ribulose-5-phosphate 4-epimerase n=1 Tax=Curtobacterium phyllosphaerae TaxID=3413379 RepID=UPI003BEFFF7C
MLDGQATLGIELGSTRIKACLVDEHLAPIATGTAEWENQLVDGRWTYDLDAVRDGLRTAYADLVRDARHRHGVAPSDVRAIGVSAMMHGYLAFDAAGELLVPFRTWRNTSTGPASAALGAALDFSVPLRWSIAHLYQAVLDDEPHVDRIARVTTLAGYVHHVLTGRDVLGVGDASGMFPVDPETHDYDADRLARAQALVAERAPALTLTDLLPEVLVAGEDAGTLTETGAAWLDPSGALRPGAPLCPPEGDAGTGMVATNAIAPRTGNVSVGTSIFAMVVLERPLGTVHPELDIVATPAGDTVAMVHCNNGASELGAWAKVFGRFAEAAGSPLDADAVYATLLAEAAGADADAGGLVTANFLSGEPVAGVEEGRPLLVRPPGSRFSLGTLVRAETSAAFATLAIGMEVLADERVRVDRMLAHGGLFRTAGVAERLLAAALDVPVAVSHTAAEGGAWGIAVLASYLEHADRQTLQQYLADALPGGDDLTTAHPDADDVAGFRTFLDRFRAALPLQDAAVAVTRGRGEPAGDADGGEARDGADPSLQSAVATTRATVTALHAELTRNGLVVWTGGNVSQRVPGHDLFVIKPSGLSYDELRPENQIVCDLDGTPVDGWGNAHAPSSDTAAHAFVYRTMPEVGGVVHTHSTYATAWAARGEAIPCVITAMADEFGGPIPVGPFAIIGDDSIGRGIVETLSGHRSRAVLMQNHGVFTIGKDGRDAVKAAVMTEDVARTVHVARQLGDPLPIPQADVDRLFDRYQNVYGQDPTGALR